METKRKNSKKKGNNFELNVCKAFNERFRTESFCRCPSSGAIGSSLFGKLSSGAQEQLSGDVMTIANFRYSLECKVGYDICLFQAFDKDDNSDKKKLVGFLKQASCDARKVPNREPCVLYKKDRRPTFVFVPFCLPSGLDLNYARLAVPDEETWKDWMMVHVEDFLNPVYFDDKWFIIE